MSRTRLILAVATILLLAALGGWLLTRRTSLVSVPWSEVQGGSRSDIQNVPASGLALAPSPEPAGPQGGSPNVGFSDLRAEESDPAGDAWALLPRTKFDFVRTLYSEPGSCGISSLLRNVTLNPRDVQISLARQVELDALLSERIREVAEFHIAVFDSISGQFQNLKRRGLARNKPLPVSQEEVHEDGSRTIRTTVEIPSYRDDGGNMVQSIAAGYESRTNTLYYAGLADMPESRQLYQELAMMQKEVGVTAVGFFLSVGCLADDEAASMFNRIEELADDRLRR